MAGPRDREASGSAEAKRPGRMGEGYFILGMAVQVGLVGLVGLALIGVQGLGFISLGTAIALAGLAIGILAVGTILTLASLRHTLNVVYEHGNRIDRIAERLGRLTDEMGIGDEAVGWTGEQEIAPLTQRESPPAPPSKDPFERRPEPGPGSPPDPLEQEPVHPVVDVPGVDPTSSEKLRDMGIEDSHQLRSADEEDIAGQLEADPEEVRGWQATAALMTVEGVDDQTARMLARSGITSVRELAHESPGRLMARIEQAELGTEGRPVGPQQADTWIQAARRAEEASEEQEV